MLVPRPVTMLMSLVVCLWCASFASSQESYAQFKEVAEKSVKARDVLVAEPVFREEGGELTAIFGNAQIYPPPPPPAENMGLAAELLDSQMRVEVLRQYPFEGEDRLIWNKVLPTADAEIEKAFDKLKDGKLTQKDLFKVDQQLNATFTMASKEMASWRGLSARPAVSAGTFTVKITTIPTGSKLWMMHALEPTLAKLEGRKPIWEMVVQRDDVPLFGKYWYFMRWSEEPSGTKKSSGPHLIKVDRSSVSIVLQ
ncbi:hypothetical protein Pan97_25520 [Bremerella volcania]|uniref:Uncharacterized protein n=2 Tax=Bremerella volcania TaxID=2527984 RepID=A0A518C8G7_9BACT|nr:hypothetical protein Pan97_25520 [Bremerella volcania]